MRSSQPLNVERRECKRQRSLIWIVLFSLTGLFVVYSVYTWFSANFLHLEVYEHSNSHVMNPVGLPSVKYLSTTGASQQWVNVTRAGEEQLSQHNVNTNNPTTRPTPSCFSDNDPTYCETVLTMIQDTNLSVWFTLPEYNPDTLSDLFLPQRHSGAGRCYTQGTVAAGNSTQDSEMCKCKPGWSGNACAIPDFVYFSLTDLMMSQMPEEGLRFADVPHRLICASLVNNEYKLMEMKVHEIGDVCDVLVIGETNNTFHGEPKPLYFLEKFKSGWLMEHQHKIMYVFTGVFAEGGVENGWKQQDYVRGFLGEKIVTHVHGYRPSDIIIYTDLDEIPRRETMLFLKMFTNYPTPFGMWMRWSLYGFFWRMNYDNRFGTEPQHKAIGATMEEFDRYFSNSTANLRQTPMQRWYIGHPLLNNDYVAGWHCSWCGSIQTIKTKLLSSPSNDGPRWGEKPQKLQHRYLSRLVKTCTWFDDMPINECIAKNWTSDALFSPAYILRHQRRYREFIVNPYT